MMICMNDFDTLYQHNFLYAHVPATTVTSALFHHSIPSPSSCQDILPSYLQSQLVVQVWLLLCSSRLLCRRTPPHPPCLAARSRICLRILLLTGKMRQGRLSLVYSSQMG